MTMTLHFNRPFIAAEGRWYKRLNWSWWLRRVPMFLLAFPSAFGVGASALGSGLPLIIAVIAGGAFEATYIGAIAIADQTQDGDDVITTVLWWLVNIAAVVASVLSNLLFFAHGTYNGITPEVATHAIPLPVLGFFYGLLLHRTTAKAAQQAMIVAEEVAAKVNCRYCGTECKNQQAEYSHFRTCLKHPSRTKA